MKNLGSPEDQGKGEDSGKVEDEVFFVFCFFFKPLREGYT